MLASVGSRRSAGANHVMAACSVVALALAGAMAMPDRALAQTAPDEGSQPGEIIVTAQKRAQNVNAVPMSITALGSQQLEQAGVKDVTDLSKVTPGLTFGQNNLGVPVLTLRGVGYNDVGIATRLPVTTYLDEAQLPFSIEAAGIGLDTERVEVLKGPQGTLFGSNSTGGAINFIARKPTDHFEAGGSATYGRFSQADLSAYISGPVSDTLSVRVAAEHRGLGDWQRSYTRADSRGQRDFNNGRVSLLWKPSSQFHALLTASGWTDRGDVQGTQLSFLLAGAQPGVATYPLSPANARAADWDAGKSFRRSNKYRQVSLRMDYDISDAVTLTSLSNYLKVNVDLLIDADGTALTATHNGQRGTSESFSQELRVAGKFDRLHVLGGVSYSNDITHDNLSSIINVSSAKAGLGFNQLDGVTNQNVKNYAVFGNAEFKVTDQLTLQGGARFTQSNNDGSTCLGLDPGDGTASAGLNGIQNFLRGLFGLAPLPPVGRGRCAAINTTTLTQQDTLMNLRLHENNVSWRAGLQFEPSNATLLYANVSKGYKQGTLPLFGGIATDEAVPVSQESVIAYEAGFKQSIADRKVQLNGAVYYSDYKNKQVLGFIPVPVLGSSAGLVNIPKSRIWGAELQAVARPVDGLTLTAAGSYTDAQISGDYTAPDALGVTRNFRGTVLPYAPKWQLSGSARYERPLSDTLKGFVGANIAYQSRSYGNIGADKILVIKPYSTTDLQLGVDGGDGKWRAYVWGRNVFDAYYWTNTAKLIDTVNRWAGMPATYGVTVAFDIK